MSETAVQQEEAEAAQCDYCGLPVGRFSLFDGRFSPGRKTSPGGGLAKPSLTATPAYCCYGCQFAAAVAQERGPQGELSWTLARLGLATFLTMNVMVFTMTLWTTDVYTADGANAALSSHLESVFRYLCLLFSLPVAWLLGAPLAESAWNSLRRRTPGTDVLLVMGVAAAYVFSAVSVFRGVGHVYFEVGCVVLVLVTLGRWLEATGKHKTTAALDSLTRLLPDTVRLLRDGQELTRPLDEVRCGDQLRILPGERLPVDGCLARGSAAIDQQIVTGESEPAIKGPGDAVFGGALNLDGELIVRVTAGPREGTLQRLVAAVQQARLAKGRYQRLADRVARWFLPAVAIIAIVTFSVHWQAEGFEHGVLAGLSVVLIACPCALGLATPMAAWAALGTASRGGVLFRDVCALERLAEARLVAFDKTGTLTTGAARLSSVVTTDDDAHCRAAALARGSTHTLAHAIGTAANTWDGFSNPSESGQAFSTSNSLSFASGSESPIALLDVAPAHELRTLPGRGIEGQFDDLDGPAVLGSLRLMRERGLSIDDSLQTAIDALIGAGRSLAAIGWEGRVRGVFGFEEELRTGARGALDDCRAHGLQVLVLTGDHAARGEAMGRELGVEVRAELLPEDKVAALWAERLARSTSGGALTKARPLTGRSTDLAGLESPAHVVMVGDGINDAPALAVADVGMALGCGADVSRQSADVCLVGNDLRRVAWSIRLARRAVRTMRQNLLWAFAYNIAGVGLAAGGLLNPIWAAAAMTISSVLVIGNSLRLSSDSALAEGASA